MTVHSSRINGHPPTPEALLRTLNLCIEPGSVAVDAPRNGSTEEPEPEPAAKPVHRRKAYSRT